MTHTLAPPNLEAARALVATLPEPVYTENYQPTYESEAPLIQTVAELQSMTPVTTPRQIDALQEQLTLLAEGKIDAPIIITGRCAEEVNLQTPIEELVDQAFSLHQLVLDAMGTAIAFLRGRGQNSKPRSESTERLADGQIVPSYMGDSINSFSPNHRKPDPRRMLAAGLQARDLEAGLTEITGQHIPAAHEALLLPYEKSFIRNEPDTGKDYLLSTDLPWIGKRTNQLNGPHVAMLAKVENPVGIKIGPDSTADHIAGLHHILNPNDKPGKLIFMLRLGPTNMAALNTVLAAIKHHSPGALLMYDIHGITRKGEKGEKIRCVPEIITDIKLTAMACRAHGLKLHGVHLETTHEATNQCVDEPHHEPAPCDIDPLLNHDQTARLLTEIKPHLL